MKAKLPQIKWGPTDNERLHKTFRYSTRFRTKRCGCVSRADGQDLHFCAEHTRGRKHHVGPSL